MDAKSAMETVQAALDNYERQLGLLHTNNVDEAEINGYFTMGRNEINSLSPLCCSEISLRLNQFAFHIQKSHNTELSRFSWANSEILKYSCDKTDQVGSQYTKFDAKIYLLSKQDEYLAKLVAIRDYAQQRLNRTEYLFSSIKNLADSFSNCGRAKIAMKDS